MVDKPNIDFPQFVWIWNFQQNQLTPPLHVSMARWLSRRWLEGDRELLLLAFRNSGKSTLVGLFCAWLLYCNPNGRILVLAGDFALAKKMVRNVKKVIERHPLTQSLKPPRTDNWASDQFTVARPAELRDPSMLAKGIAANVTGLRADVVICDDVEVPNTCDTALKRADLRTRLHEIDYVLVPGGLKLYVGTPHTYYTIYADQARAELGETKPLLDGFSRLVLPITDTEGKSRWPERFPVEKIEAMRARTGPAKFASQMMLTPRNIVDSRLEPERIQLYDDDLEYTEGNRQARLTLGGKQLISVSSWWDPAYGSPTGGDASVLAAVYTDDEGYYWLHRVLYLQHDPALSEQLDEATQLCRQAAAFAKALHLPAITLETNGLGRFLPGLLRQEIRTAGLRCAVLEAHSSRNKDIRIIDAFDAVLAAGRLRAHRSVWQTSFIEEMRQWRPGLRGRDDALDAVAGCLLSEPVRLPRRAETDRTPPSRYPWRPAQSVSVAECDFPIR